MGGMISVRGARENNLRGIAVRTQYDVGSTGGGVRSQQHLSLLRSSSGAQTGGLCLLVGRQVGLRADDDLSGDHAQTRSEGSRAEIETIARVATGVGLVRERAQVAVRHLPEESPAR